MMNAPASPVLSVRNLCVELRDRLGRFRPVDDVSFSLAEGEILGLVGDSGAGKSMTGGAIANLLDPPARIESGEIRLDGSRIDDLPVHAMRRLRGARVAYVVQNPMSALDPLSTIGDMMLGTLNAHATMRKARAWARAIELLAAVNLPDPDRHMKQYPHELSGGMLQRVVIATAIAHNPRLIIADEPTSALDVTSQAQIMQLLRRLSQDQRIAILLISHNIGVVAEICSRLAVMYAGRIVEVGPARDVIAEPMHPYTRGLLDCVPRIGSSLQALPSIGGAAPRLDAIPQGCAFHPRCDRRFAPCQTQRPPLLETDGRQAACWLVLEPLDD